MSALRIIKYTTTPFTLCRNFDGICLSKLIDKMELQNGYINCCYNLDDIMQNILLSQRNAAPITDGTYKELLRIVKVTENAIPHATNRPVSAEPEILRIEKDEKKYLGNKFMSLITAYRKIKFTSNRDLAGKDQDEPFPYGRQAVKSRPRVGNCQEMTEYCMSKILENPQLRLYDYYVCSVPRTENTINNHEFIVVAPHPYVKYDDVSEKRCEEENETRNTSDVRVIVDCWSGEVYPFNNVYHYPGSSIIAEKRNMFDEARQMINSADTWDIQYSWDGKYLVRINYDCVEGTEGIEGIEGMPITRERWTLKSETEGVRYIDHKGPEQIKKPEQVQEESDTSDLSKHHQVSLADSQ